MLLPHFLERPIVKKTLARREKQGTGLVSTISPIAPSLSIMESILVAWAWKRRTETSKSRTRFILDRLDCSKLAIADLKDEDLFGFKDLV